MATVRPIVKAENLKCLIGYKLKGTFDGNSNFENGVEVQDNMILEFVGPNDEEGILVICEDGLVSCGVDKPVLN